MGDNARIEGFKLHSTSCDFGLVVRVSRTLSHPYTKHYLFFASCVDICGIPLVDTKDLSDIMSGIALDLRMSLDQGRSWLATPTMLWLAAVPEGKIECMQGLSESAELFLDLVNRIIEEEKIKYCRPVFSYKYYLLSIYVMSFGH